MSQAGIISGNSSSIAGIGSGVYGDGSDGSVTFDGSTTILGLVPMGNAYTLQRDLFLSSSTIKDAVNNSGGWGAGAGAVLIAALYFSGTGNIQALGGNGGNGAIAGTNCGGGGGGGGGILYITSRSVFAGLIIGQTLSVAGGIGGTGSGTGLSGSNGGAGTIFTTIM